MQIDIPKIVSILKEGLPVSCFSLEEGDAECVFVAVLPEYKEQAIAFAEGLIEAHKQAKGGGAQ